MEGNNNHGYLQEDVSYDDLMNNAGWPASTDHYPYTQAHPAQASYTTPYSTTSQLSYDHYDLSQQPSYSPVTFSNSPYASQYQHARPSDVFGPSSYSLDPSLQGSAAYSGSEGSFSFAPHGTESTTISPHSLQYNMPMNQTPVIGGVSGSAFQRTASDFIQNPQDHPAIFQDSTQNSNMQNTGASITYPAFANGSSDHDSKQILTKFGDSGNFSSASASASASAPRAQQTRAEQGQNPLRVTHPDLYAAKNNSSRPRLEYAPFLVWDDNPLQVALGLKNTLPKYHPRKSRSGKELVPGLDISRTSAPPRISIKKTKAPKEAKPALSKYKGTSQVPKQAVVKLAIVRGDDVNLGAVKPASPPTESSSSSSESSSEEESEYEEDGEMSVKDISEVRAATRPSDSAEAAGWDAVGIIWKDPNSNPNADVVKGAIEEYGNFVSALRVKLKTNSTQIEEAASRQAEVERLKENRKVLLESLYQTINAANTLGYGAIVENLGGHQKLVNGLTTTLIECIKTEDFVGKLPKAVFSLLAKFQTMSDALLKKLKFDSIQKRWNKRGDESTKKYIATILANTTDAKERAAKEKKEASRGEEEKNLRDKVEQVKVRIAEPVKALSGITSAKRPHDGDGVNGKPNKKFASDVAGTPSSSSKPIPTKRPTNLLANNLLGISSKSTAKPAPKKRESSPPAESKLGALLAQIAKPVEPRKAPEAPPRPLESPEERKRRERKESRRHLRVKFKEGPELEQVRLFKHEQAEDEGRQDDMLRDAHDGRSEGMMHKKRVSETMDSAMEDDDYVPEGFEDHPYPDLVGIDFSDLDKATMFGPTYATRGGEKSITTTEQQTQERREALELMVVYTDPNDIPPSPKEPPHGDTAGLQQELQLKGPTENWVLQRLQEVQLYGPEYASQLMQERKFRELQDNHAREIGQPLPSSSSTNISTVLKKLGGHTASSQLFQQASMESKAWEVVTRIVASLKGKPFPPTEPPDWMTDPARRAAWWEGYNIDNAIHEKRVADVQMAQLKAPHFQPTSVFPTQNHQQMPISQMHSFPQQPPQPNSSLPQGADIAQQMMQNYLAGLQGGENAKDSSHQQYDFSGWSTGNGQSQDYTNQNQRPRWDGERDEDSLRSRAKQSHDESNPNGKQRGYEMKQWNGGYGNDGPLDQNGEYKGKKKPCRFWREGKCAKGSKCTFLHEERT